MRSRARWASWAGRKCTTVRPRTARSVPVMPRVPARGPHRECRRQTGAGRSRDRGSPHRSEGLVLSQPQQLLRAESGDGGSAARSRAPASPAARAVRAPAVSCFRPRGRRSAAVRRTGAAQARRRRTASLSPQVAPVQPARRRRRRPREPAGAGMCLCQAPAAQRARLSRSRSRDRLRSLGRTVDHRRPQDRPVKSAPADLVLRGQPDLLRRRVKGRRHRGGGDEDGPRDARLLGGGDNARAVAEAERRDADQGITAGPRRTPRRDGGRHRDHR